MAVFSTANVHVATLNLFKRYARPVFVESLARCWKSRVPRPLARWPASRLCLTVASTTSPACSWLIPANHQSISATGIIHLTSLFSQSDRHEEDQTGRYATNTEGTTMKKFGFATIVASRLAAAGPRRPRAG